MNLLDDPQFKTDILDGYDGLTELLRELDEGAGLYRTMESGCVDMEGQDLERIEGQLQRLREALRKLIVGGSIDKS